MAMAVKQLQRLGQSLAMTPQLLQSIRLLQLGHLELAAYVEAEAAANPLLEIPGLETGQPVGGEAPAAPVETVAAADVEMARDLAPGEGDFERRLGGSAENLFDDAPPVVARPLDAPRTRLRDGVAAGNADIDLPEIGERIAAGVSMISHLQEQVALAFRDPAERALAEAIVGGLDDDGYLRRALPEIAAELALPTALAERVHAKILRFDPTGVGARHPGECLAAQLAEKNRLDPAMQAMLARLDLVARRDLGALSRLCGVDARDVADMLAEIRELDPRPGLRFGAALAPVIVPDVLVYPRSDGGWTVELNPAALPRVLVNRQYCREVSAATRDPRARAWIADKLQGANWLVRSLDQRAQSILKVAGEIVKRQDGFFADGPDRLRPLNQKTVADAIGMHESTVSRVTSNKYMLTHRGLFAMKHFFSNAIAAADGSMDDHAAAAVRHRIRRLIDGETHDAVLSDDAIVDRLRASGVDIARRTVAKYREAMRIPSSIERRRAKRSPRAAAGAAPQPVTPHSAAP